MKKEHTPAPPTKIGTASGLVYCNVCLHLLYSPAKGATKASFDSCVPAKLVFK